MDYKQGLEIQDLSEGNIDGCSTYGGDCGYYCCHQQAPGKGEKPKPEESILLYPGEWEGAIETAQQHIGILDNDYHGGKLGFCDPRQIDQTVCHTSRNFKSLDCRSYPFFPAVTYGRVLLLKDTRCPLGEEWMDSLIKHYFKVLGAWERLVRCRPEVGDWLARIRLKGYGIYRP